MSFEFITGSDLRQPEATAYQEDDHLVIHEDLNPYGWIASDTTAEVRQ